MRTFLVVMLLTLPLCAELRQVEMTLSGLDCDSCALSVDQKVKRIRGVDTATFDAKTNLLTVTFKPDNKVKLSALRDAAKNLGYTPGETKIVARGSLTQTAAGGEWTFEIAGVDSPLKVEVPESLRKMAGPDVVVEGTIPEKSQELLQVNSIKRPD